MLGLDASTLAVADYEIIARIERIITSFNGGVLPVQIQPVARNETSSTYQLHHHDLYSSSSDVRSSSPTRRVHHSHSHHVQRERSVSPHRHSSNGHTCHKHYESNDSTSSTSNTHHHHHHSSPSRHRSKSPRKVTIDPNSY